MFTLRARRLAVSTLSAVALTAAGCAPAGLESSPEPAASQTAPTAASPSPTAVASPSAVASPTPTAAPSPTASPTLSVPASASATPTATPSSRPSYTGDPNAIVKGSNHIGSAEAYVYPAQLVQQWLEGEVKPTEKIVFLTFDDGPNQTTTPIILDALKEAGVHATFYVIGSNVGDNPDLLKQELAEGHAINLHSWSHDYKKLYPGRKANAERVESEYVKTLEAVQSILGPEFNTEGWRYPGGHMSWKNMAGADEALASHGVHWVDWNADTRDSAPKSSRPSSVDEMVQNATEPIRAGFHVAVILGHDTPDKMLTAESVPAIIAAYKEAGFKFGVIS